MTASKSQGMGVIWNTGICRTEKAYGCYRFVVDEDGCIPDEDEDLVKHGTDAYFDIALAGLVKEKDVVTKRQIRHAMEWILHMNDGKDVSEERLKGVNDAYSVLTNLLLLNKWQI